MKRLDSPGFNSGIWIGIMLLGSLFGSFSCTENKSKVKVAEGNKRGFKEIPGWIGTFQDTLPCADCPGLLTWLEIKPDGYYRLISTRIGEADVFSHTFSRIARWKFDSENQVLKLDSMPGKSGLCLTPLNDSVLIACDRKGIPLSQGRWKIRRRSGGDGLPSSKQKETI